MKRVLGICILFFAVAFLIYGKSLGNLFVRWDDSLLIYENPIIREISRKTVKAAFTTYDPELYVPLTMISYQIDHLLWGMNPFGFHLTNLVLHTMNALLVTVFIQLLMRRSPYHLLPVLCGLLFLVHPLHTEAVAWASARKDVLSSFFFLLSVCSYLQWRGRENGQAGSGKLLYSFSIFAFALGLLAKVSIIMLPVILLLIEWLLYHRRLRASSFVTISRLTPYFLLSVMFGIVGFFGKREAFSFATYFEKAIVAPKSTLFYLEKFFWPTEFSVLYPYTDASIASPEFFIPLVIVMAITFLVLFLKKYQCVLAFSYFFFLITLLPTFLNIARGGDMDRYFASDRYAYIPSIGLIFIIGVIAHRHRKFAVTACVVLLGILGVRAHAQSLLWGDTEVLLQNVLKQYGELSHVAHNNMGNVYRLRGEHEKAIAEYEKAIAIRPHSKIFANLGATYRRMHRYTDAQKMYDEALRQNPDNAEVHVGLGLVYVELGQTDAAREAYEKAIALRSDLEEAHVNLGALAMQEGKFDEAIGHYRNALDANPYFFHASYNLGVALQEQGKIEDAIAAYERAIRLLPTHIAARINLGILYANSGRLADAIVEFETVLAIDPKNSSAQSALKQLGE